MKQPCKNLCIAAREAAQNAEKIETDATIKRGRTALTKIVGESFINQCKWNQEKKLYEICGHTFRLVKNVSQYENISCHPDYKFHYHLIGSKIVDYALCPTYWDDYNFWRITSLVGLGQFFKSRDQKKQNAKPPLTLWKKMIYLVSSLKIRLIGVGSKDL